MSFASLLHVPDSAAGRKAFSFEHLQAHRDLFGAMEPLTGFSVLPYLLDPTFNFQKWHRNHQQAHQDFIISLPSYLGATATGLPTSQPLEDTSLDNTRRRIWWTFVNHQEHYTALAVVETALLYPYG